MKELFDIAVTTIFAREVLEGGIIIGEYRTVIKRTDWQNSDLTQEEALRAVTVAAIVAAALALLVCAAIAIPLLVLSKDFNKDTAIIVEGVSKIVAAICILQLSLKMPKFFGLYYSKAQVKKLKNGEILEDEAVSNDMNMRSIQFNVAWNIWREGFECGVFLIPFFLDGEGITSIPLSAVLGCVIGTLICLGIYHANHNMKSTVGLTIFTVGLLLLLATGLFSGGCHKFEIVYPESIATEEVWSLENDFWSVEKLPMTVFKPFGYSDTRTVLQMATFWGYLFCGLALHYRKYKLCRKSHEKDGVNSELSGNETLVPGSTLTISDEGGIRTDSSEEGGIRTDSSEELGSRADNEDIEEGETALEILR